MIDILFVSSPERNALIVQFWVLFTYTIEWPSFWSLNWSYVNQFNSLRPSDAYICVGNLTIIGSDNGLWPGWRQAIISTNTRILLIGPLGINLHEILIQIHTFSFKKMCLKRLSAKWRPFCLGLNVLTCQVLNKNGQHVADNILKLHFLRYKSWNNNLIELTSILVAWSNVD